MQMGDTTREVGRMEFSKIKQRLREQKKQLCVKKQKL